MVPESKDAFLRHVLHHQYMPQKALKKKTGLKRHHDL